MFPAFKIDRSLLHTAYSFVFQLSFHFHFRISDIEWLIGAERLP